MPTLDATALQQWVTEHLKQIYAFIDYEATFDHDEDMHDTLSTWLGSHDWSSDDRFVPLGIDPTGGLFLVWVRADGQTPVVFLGSEGSVGVLTATPTAFAQALAHRPVVTAFSDPAALAPFDEADARTEDEEAEAASALSAYRRAVEDRLGPPPPLAELTRGLDGLNRELHAWIAARSPHFR